jgi:acetoin utilization protein AcuB
MTARELISTTIDALNPSDTGEQAINLMHNYYLQHLPVVKDGELLGLISEDTVLNYDLSLAIAMLNINMQALYCLETDHLFDIMHRMAANKLTCMPIVNSSHKYVGLVTATDIMNKWSESFTFAQQGSVIAISTTRQNYSLAALSQIAEAEGILVLGSMINQVPDSNELIINLKLNTHDISKLIRAYQRYDINVAAVYTHELVDDLYTERYHSLMHFLNI